VRTIHRILERRGVLDGRRRIRRPAPPPGWHLPEVASKRQELDSFDVVEGLVIKGGPQIEVLNGISLHGGLAASWPMEASVTAKSVVASLIEHWRVFGPPGYAQFDNDTIFQGTHARPGSLPDLQGHSQRYVTALRRHRADRIESAPQRRAFPSDWRLNLRSWPRGRIIYPRRTGAVGAVEVMGRSSAVDEHRLNRLVRVEVDLDEDTIRIYRLRRREPKDQPLLKELHYHIKMRRFSE
jgi:hypothetical protein